VARPMPAEPPTTRTVWPSRGVEVMAPDPLARGYL
jgi:hypothetical protein